VRIIKTSTYSERFKSWVYDINYEETFALLLILLPHYEVLAGCCCCQIVSIISYGCQELMSSSKGIFQNNCIDPSSSRHDHLLEKVYHFIELYIYMISNKIPTFDLRNTTLPWVILDSLQTHATSAMCWSYNYYKG
jgi:hypothetical protein